jgi:UDP-glucose 4-epimerase
VKKKKYLITGSSGFIGKRLLYFLNEKNCDVKVLSRKKNLKYETIICDFEKDDIPISTLDSIDTVFHLAGMAHDLRNQKKVEQLYNLVNVDMTVRLAKLAVQSGVKNFVFISSVKAGGIPLDGECGNERSQSYPNDTYGKTKRDAELRLIEIGKKSNMIISIIRPSLVYGPGMKGNLRMMMSGIKNGWFPPLPKIPSKRSLIYIDDLISAIFLVEQSNGNSGEVYIATDGHIYSSHEIYESICLVLNKKIPSWTIPIFVFDILSLLSPKAKHKINKLLGNECYSSKKLESLGFKPKMKLKDMNETSF